MIIRKQYYWGYLIVGLSLMLTYAIYLGSMWFYDDWYEYRLNYLAIIGSMGTTMLMCWALVIFHGVLAQGEIMSYPVLGAGFAVWTAVGMCCYFYIRVLYRWLGYRGGHCPGSGRGRGERGGQLFQQ